MLVVQYSLLVKVANSGFSVPHLPAMVPTKSCQRDTSSFPLIHTTGSEIQCMMVKSFPAELFACSCTFPDRIKTNQLPHMYIRADPRQGSCRCNQSMRCISQEEAYYPIGLHVSAVWLEITRRPAKQVLASAVSFSSVCRSLVRRVTMCIVRLVSGNVFCLLARTASSNISLLSPWLYNNFVRQC